MVVLTLAAGLPAGTTSSSWRSRWGTRDGAAGRPAAARHPVAVDVEAAAVRRSACEARTEIRPARMARSTCMLRWLTAGESHGRALVAICEGIPAGVEITTDDIAAALARRRAGVRPGRPDEVRAGRGRDHRRGPARPDARRAGRDHGWPTPNGPSGSRSCRPTRSTPAVLAGQARNAPLTRPRPGHADLAGMQKYGHDDARPVLERASARETAARVALGELARRFLHQALGAEIVSHVVAIGQRSGS